MGEVNPQDAVRIMSATARVFGDLVEGALHETSFVVAPVVDLGEAGPVRPEFTV